MEEQEKKPFCGSCDSKGRIHKKGCPADSSSSSNVATAERESPLGEKGLNEEIRKRTERFAERMTPEAKRHPDIRAGICEFCGEHYASCMHYRGIDIYCTYCGRKDIIPSRSLKIYSLTSNPGQFIIVCDDFECSNSHIKRFTKK